MHAVVECGNLPNPRNGRVDLTGTTFGSSATYSCNNNYMLDGPQTRRCQADGTWSGREPTCERMQQLNIATRPSLSVELSIYLLLCLQVMSLTVAHWKTRRMAAWISLMEPQRDLLLSTPVSLDTS